MPGFDYKFLEKPKRRLLCPLCAKAMREPVQVSTCGHRFCDTCLQEFLSEGVFKCPEDQLPLDYAKIYPDPELEAQVLSLPIRCIHSEEGCRWTGALRQLQVHLSSCGYNVVACPNRCNGKLSRRDLPSHLQHECPKRRLKCDFCGIDFTGEAFEPRGGLPAGERVLREQVRGPHDEAAAGPAHDGRVPQAYPALCLLHQGVCLRYHPEPPAPVPPLPHSMPQPVRDGQHPPRGLEQPPEGELQHGARPVPLQGRRLQAPVPQAGDGPPHGGEREAAPGHDVRAGEPAAAGAAGAAQGRGGAVGGLRRGPHLEDRRLRAPPAGGQGPRQPRVLQPGLLHPQVRLQAAGVGLPQRQRQRRGHPPVALHPRAARRLRQPARVALRPARHLLAAGPERPGRGQAAARHGDLPPGPPLEELPEAGHLEGLHGRERPGLRLPQVHLPPGHPQAELCARRRRLHPGLRGAAQEDPELRPGEARPCCRGPGQAGGCDDGRGTEGGGPPLPTRPPPLPPPHPFLRCLFLVLFPQFPAPAPQGKGRGTAHWGLQGLEIKDPTSCLLSRGGPQLPCPTARCTVLGSKVSGLAPIPRAIGRGGAGVSHRWCGQLVFFNSSPPPPPKLCPLWLFIPQCPAGHSRGALVCNKFWIVYLLTLSSPALLGEGRMAWLAQRAGKGVTSDPGDAPLYPQLGRIFPSST